MNTSYYFFYSYEISVNLYNCCTDWKTKLNYALLNTKTCAIAFSHKSDLIYEFRLDAELLSRYNLPITTATSIIINNINHVNVVIFAQLFKKNLHCYLVSISVDSNLTVDTIQKISKLCAKRNIRVTYTGPQTEVFNDLLKKYEAIYENEVKEYHSRGSNRHDEEIKKRKHDTIIMEVPKDRSKRLKFLLEEASKLVDNSSAVQHESSDLSVTSNLQRVLSPGSQYKHFEDSGLVDVYNFMSMSTKALEDRVSELATVFIESIIDFGAIKIYMTSADFFLHNHMTIDDCANERTINDMYDLPTATVKENTYMNSAKYYELSIHWGFVEILFTGGFYVVDQSPDLLLLGSSLKCWRYGELTSSNIHVLDNTVVKKTYRSPRLLNQYSRRDSHRPWGFHSIRSYIQGYTPILPINLLGHASQKKKQFNIAHFASEVLCIITQPNITTNNDIVDLFLLFAASKMFLDIHKKTQDIPINFKELQLALQKDSKPPVFLSSLIDVAVKIEAIFDNCESCYVSCVLDDVKSISLGIVKNGLKKAITTETERIVKSYI